MAYSPLEQFEVAPLLLVTGPIVGDMVFALTNFVVWTVAVVAIVLGMHTYANNEYRLVPSHWSVAIETVYATVSSIVRGQIGERLEMYLPFIYTLFWFLLVVNLTGNVPYGHTITASGVAAMGLSLTIFLAVTIIGFTRHWLHFFAFFVPTGTPLGLVPVLVLIEVISYLARALSLGLRICANMLAGHMLLSILASFLFTLFTYSYVVAIATLVPFAIFVALMVLELAIAVIQAYVFVVLTSSYVKDAELLH